MIHVPEDMTVTVEADVALAVLQEALAQSRQWLPLDPANPQLTLREILDRNESGPRRFGYGTVRDYVIGLRVELADGRIVKSGGQVVKNVAGYDLQKLFIGSGGTLGTIREVTFKLRPMPETERFVRREFDALDASGDAIETVLASELKPIVCDTYRADREKLSVVLGFDGTVPEVDWQLELAATLGFTAPASLGYDTTFRADPTSLRTVPVLPSRLIEMLRGLGDSPFVARAGNGIVFHRANGIVPPNPSRPVAHLQRRLKDAFDPNHFLPALPA